MKVLLNSIKPHGASVLDTLVLLGCLILVAWAGVYLGHYGGRFDGNEFDAVPTKRIVPSSPSSPTRAPESPEFKRGRTVFFDLCQSCHGDRGEGDDSKGFPPLDKSEWVTSPGAGRLIRILLEGVDGPIRVAGRDYNNTGGMFAWGPGGSNSLSEADLAAVATFIRQAWSNKASPVTVDQIKAVLAETSGRRGVRWTAAELETVSDAADAAVPKLTHEQLVNQLKALPAEQLQEILKEFGK